MFGFGKQKRMQGLWEDIAGKLHNVLPFPRYLNDGHVPESLKNNNYVLGYHFGLCLNLYTESVKGRTNLEEQGFVLMNALAIALEMDAQEVFQRLDPLMANPDADFKRGFEHANSAYDLIGEGDVTAFLEFNENIRGNY